MQNNGFYFVRKIHKDEPLSRDSDRTYPPDVFPFGSAEIELFAYESDGWAVAEKKSGTLVARGEDMDTAIKQAHDIIDQIGRDVFVEAIKDTVKKLNDGLRYDYERSEWL